MWDQLTELMNKFRAGDVLIVLGILFWICSEGYKKIKEVLDANSSRTEDRLQREEMLHQMQEDIESTSRDLSRIQTELDQQLQNLTDKISNNLDTKLVGERERIDEMISELHRLVDNQTEQFLEASRRLSKIEQDIRILFQNDTNTYKEGIELAYKKYVDGNEPITLQELKHVEDLYNSCLEQNNGQCDPFITTMVTRIRNLPTVKRNDRDQE